MTAGAAPESARTRLLVDMTMLSLAVASLGLVLFEITSQADLTREQLILLDGIDLVIVLVFLSEFVWSARRSGAPWKYARKNWYDIPSMIWLPGSLFSGLVGLRLLRFVRLIRVLRTASRLHRISQHLGGRLQEQVIYVSIVAVATVLFGAMSAFVLEQDANPQFGTLYDALWWAVVTVATVGYGDIIPTTTGGRLVAVLLMTVGVGIIGFSAGTVAQLLFAKRDAAKRRVHSRWHRQRN